MTEATTEADYKLLRKQFYALALGYGLIFWYGIEKLFQSKIGLSLSQIVVLGAVIQGSKIIIELPTSVVADRWSRRNILVVSVVLLGACSIVLGFANSFTAYLLGALLWSVSDALSSGVHEAFMYDSLATKGYKARFKRFYTRTEVIGMIAISVAGLIAGPLSNLTSFRFTYFISAVAPAMMVFVLLKMKEPPIVRSTSELGWLGHIGGAVRTMRKQDLKWPLFIYILIFGFTSLLYEYYQLVGLDLKLSTVVFGAMIAIIGFGEAAGAELAHKFAGSKKTIGLLWVALIAAHLLGLHLPSAWLVLFAMFAIFLSLNMLRIYLELYLQEHIDSSQRATILSLATTLSYLIFFGLVLAFGLSLSRFGARTALSIASIPLVIVGLVDFYKRLPWASNRHAETLELPK